MLFSFFMLFLCWNFHIHSLLAESLSFFFVHAIYILSAEVCPVFRMKLIHCGSGH